MQNWSSGFFSIENISKVTSNPYLVAIRDGLTLTLPIIIAATLVILINNFPSHTYASTMTAIFGEQWKLFGAYIYNGTFGIISIIMVLSISFSLAEDHNAIAPFDRISPILLSLVSLSCLLCLMEPGILTQGGQDYTAYIMRWLGVHGLLLATLVALISCALFRFFLKFSELRIVLYTGSSGSAMTQAMNVLIPSLLTIAVFGLIKVIMALNGIKDINESIYGLLHLPFHNLGGHNIETASIYGFARHFLWFFGVHGSNVLEPVMEELYVPAIGLNEAYNQMPLYISQVNRDSFAIFTKPFFDCYTSMGGAGSTIGLLIACLLYHKDSGTRRIAKISLLPCIFNINEILLFGLPVVLNPVFFIPFLAVPLVTTVTSYAAMMLDIAPLTVAPIDWNIPLLYNAYKTTGSIGGTVLQLVNTAIATAIYLPFVSLDNKIKKEQFSKSYSKLKEAAFESGEKEASPTRLLSLPNPVGPLALNLARDLQRAKDRGEIFFQYQPQVDSCSGRVVGVESLIRWKHSEIGLVPPPLIIGLAEDTRQIGELGLWAFEQSVQQIAQWRKAGMNDLVMSVNLSVHQLHDHELPEKMLTIINENQVPIECVKLELTESNALTSKMVKSHVLQKLSDMKLKLAIDDFGMGHSSITYLKRFAVNSIKLDGILTRDILISRNSCEIIYSIAELSRSLNIDVVAEFVEDEEHLLRLRELGCNIIQGYFYSQPLMPANCFDFIIKKHTSYGPLKAPNITNLSFRN